VTISELSRIDIVAIGSDGTTRLLAVVSDWEPESLRLAQLAVKLMAMRGYGEEHQPYRIEVVCYAEPPESAVGLIRSTGGVVTRENSEPTDGVPGTFRLTDSGELDWPAIQAANAALFAQQHGLPGTLESLAQLDALLGDAYTAAAAENGGDGDVPEDGDLAILAGAYASQVMLTAFGGSWLPADPESHLPDLRISVGPNGHLVVGAAVKVRKFLRDGPADAVYPLARFLAEKLA
jgi:hypothetical protein